VAEKIRVLITDDHAVVRQGLRAFLQLQPDIEVVGEAGGGGEALILAERLEPHVVLMDLVMPEGDGIAAIRALGTVPRPPRVLVLTSFTDDGQVFSAMQAGASGYLLKDVEPDDLAAAIREVHRGRPALHPDIAARLMRRVSDPAGDQLTRLFISEKTVKTHVSNILAKLGVADRTQAAVLAIRNRLV
jgi:NarL family two-component system response regulator LiaR